MISSPEERQRLRRTRRWKRRVRIAAPFLCLPPLVGVLMLSVDLIEYQPQRPRERLNDRPIARTEPAPTRVDRASLAPGSSPSISVSASSVVDARALRASELDSASADPFALEMRIQAPESLRPSARPHALGTP